MASSSTPRSPLKTLVGTRPVRLAAVVVVEGTTRVLRVPLVAVAADPRLGELEEQHKWEHSDQREQARTEVYRVVQWWGMEILILKIHVMKSQE